MPNASKKTTIAYDEPGHGKPRALIRTHRDTCFNSGAAFRNANETRYAKKLRSRLNSLGCVAQIKGLLNCARRLGHQKKAEGSRMEKSTKYEKFAQECAVLMGKTETEGDRKVLMEMAESWNRLAEEAERRERYRGPC